MDSPPSSLRSRKHPWEPATSHANGYAHDSSSHDSNSDDDTKKRSPAAIFAYTSALTLALVLSSEAALYTALIPTAKTISASPTWSSTLAPYWRLPFFLSTLSLFHLLEYLVTALYNAQFATTTAFLLNNGKAYNIAHCLAFLECFSRLYFFPSSSMISFPGSTSPSSAEESPGAISALSWWPLLPLSLGFAMIIGGQTVRTMAMATAGSNFNHIVQSQRRNDHVLVTDGIYRWLRHPSYFGFFWWGLGTQLVLGNVICLVGYAVVLRKFFSRRIAKEEEFLVDFFDDEYKQYRQRTHVGIPFL